MQTPHRWLWILSWAAAASWLVWTVLSWTLGTSHPEAAVRIAFDLAATLCAIAALGLAHRRVLIAAAAVTGLALLFLALDDLDFLLGLSGSGAPLWSWGVPGFFGIYPYIEGVAIAGFVMLGVRPGGAGRVLAWLAAAATLAVLVTMLAAPTPDGSSLAAFDDWRARYEPYRLAIRIGNTVEWLSLGAWYALLPWPGRATAVSSMPSATPP